MKRDLNFEYKFFSDTNAIRTNHVVFVITRKDKIMSRQNNANKPLVHCNQYYTDSQLPNMQ